MIADAVLKLAAPLQLTVQSSACCAADRKPQSLQPGDQPAVKPAGNNLEKLYMHTTGETQ